MRLSSNQYHILYGMCKEVLGDDFLKINPYQLGLRLRDEMTINRVYKQMLYGDKQVTKYSLWNYDRPYKFHKSMRLAAKRLCDYDNLAGAYMPPERTERV